MTKFTKKQCSKVLRLCVFAGLLAFSRAPITIIFGFVSIASILVFGKDIIKSIISYNRNHKNKNYEVENENQESSKDQEKAKKKEYSCATKEPLTQKVVDESKYDYVYTDTSYGYKGSQICDPVYIGECANNEKAQVLTRKYSNH